jgi:ABC-type branched-subunit amino acid transport system substrate-binding protein
VVLPLGGSPAFQAFAEEVLEGVEAAVSAWDLEGLVELLVLDDAGEPGMVADLVRSAEDRGAVAVVGLLEDTTLLEASAGRRTVPLVSPTAYEVPAETQGVLSLNTFDPGAAESLAEWAASSGIRQVVVIHASSGVSADEARVFSSVFQERGGSVLRSFAYEPGATFWEEQIMGAAELLPEALVLPVPPEDLPGMAPQVTFFGLDTLGIRILGTGGWTDPQILQDVDPRHTDGVVVATPVRPDTAAEGYSRFREAYEGRFRRSLVNGVVQALGYDAASLVFHGIYAGADSPGEVSDALARLANLQGATGDLSVTEGQVRRRHHLVCLADRIQFPILQGQLPTQLYRPYQPDEETGIVPEGPGRPNGFECPLPMDEALRGDTLRAPGASR